MIQGSTPHQKGLGEDHTAVLVLSLALTALIAIGIGGLLFYLHLKDLAIQEAQTHTTYTARLSARQVDTLITHKKHGASLLAKEPSLRNFLISPTSFDTSAANSTLDRYCDSFGASACYLMDKTGNTKLSTNRHTDESFIGKNYSFRPYFKQAIKGEQSIYAALGVTSKKRGLYFSNPIQASYDTIEGVVVIKYALKDIEESFSNLPGIIALVDPQGIIFASNRSSWLFKSLFPLSSLQQQEVQKSRQFGNQVPESINLRNIENGLLASSDDQAFLFHRSNLSQLSDWQIHYLFNADTVVPKLLAEHRYIGVVAAALILAFATAILMLFSKSRKELQLRHASNLALKESEKRFELLVNIANEALFVVDGDQYIDCNPYAEKLLNYSRSQILNLRVKDVVAPEFYEQSIQMVRQESEEPYETAVITKDGVVIPVEAIGKNMEWNGNHVRVVSVRDLTFQKEQEKKILYHAHYDTLTDLPNRILSKDRIDQAIKQAKRESTHLVIMLIDLDDFKKINDSLNHETGDQFIQEAARRLTACVRENDTVARHGGDEFVVVIDDLTDIMDVEPIVKKIQHALSKPFGVDSMEVVITASIGLSVYPNDGNDYKTLLQNADVAMYKAKAEGKNRFHFYTHSLNRQALRQLEIDRHLRQALKRDELFLTYQPLVNCNTLELEGAEVLLRWKNPELGHVSPIEFIPIAEQTGLIVDIGAWVLQQAAIQAQTWIKQTGKPFRVAVNVSPRQFQNSKFIDTVRDILHHSDLPTNCLQLEVTEGLLVNQNSETDAILRQLNRMGIRLSMDDFGTGYSSLSYLKNFPFQNLKIDRSFTKDVTYDRDAQILVTATIAMAQGLGLTVTAEGIETEDQMNFMRDKGCNLLQGYLLGKPIKAKEFQEQHIPSNKPKIFLVKNQ